MRKCLRRLFFVFRRVCLLLAPVSLRMDAVSFVPEETSDDGIPRGDIEDSLVLRVLLIVGKIQVANVVMRVTFRGDSLLPSPSCVVGVNSDATSETNDGTSRRHSV